MKYSGRIIIGLVLLFTLAAVVAIQLNAQTSTEAETSLPENADSPVHSEEYPEGEYPEGTPQYDPADPAMYPSETPPPIVDEDETSLSANEVIEDTRFYIDEEEIEKSIEVEEETLSMDLRGIAVTEFFKVLSKKLKINIIPSKQVTGKINLFLNDITYSDAFEVIMLSQGLAYEKKSDAIIIVMTEAEYETLYGEKFNEKKKIKTLKLRYAKPKIVFNALTKIKSNIGKIVVDEVTGVIILIDTPEKLTVMEDVFNNLDNATSTEIFELQYATAADISENLTSIVTDGTGKVLTDERTNSVIVTDLPGNMERIRQAVLMLDQETKQVFIETQILEISFQDRLQGGVDWDKIMSNNVMDWALAGTFSSGLTAGLMGTFTSDKPGFSLEFLNTIADTRVISRPTIAVTNGEEATILVGTREAYITGTTSQSGESTITSDTVEFVDVGVKLKVVPTINRDGFVTMKVKPEISSVSRTLTTGTEDEPRSQIPIVTTSEAETTVKVKDGSTIMIAGLRRNQDGKDIDGVPFFSRIPILNFFFSRTDLDQDQTELIIFITPHIIKGEFEQAWDQKHMKEFPKHSWPENQRNPAQKIDRNSLKKFKNTGR